MLVAICPARANNGRPLLVISDDHAKLPKHADTVREFRYGNRRQIGDAIKTFEGQGYSVVVDADGFVYRTRDWPSIAKSN